MCDRSRVDSTTKMERDARGRHKQRLSERQQQRQPEKDPREKMQKVGKKWRSNNSNNVSRPCRRSRDE